jgi:hypothetical protein
MKFLKTVADKKRLSVYVIGLLFVIASVFLVHAHQPNTSDEVTIQTISSQHLKFKGDGRAWLGEDNYIFKVPFYFALGGLFDNSRTVLLVTSIVFNVLGFGLFFYSSYYFYRKFKAKDGLIHLSLLWLASICLSYLMLIMINPNQRNLEIGLYFLILVLLSRYIDKDFSFAGRRGKALAVLLAAFFGLMLYSDPFLVFMLVAPVLLLFGGYLYFQKFHERMFRASLFFVGSLGFSVIWKLFFERLHIIARSPQTNIILFDELGQNIVKLFKAYFLFFSAHFWGEKALDLGTVRLLLNALVLGGFVIAPFVLLRIKRPKGKRLDPWLLFWLVQPFYISLVFLMSGNTVENGDGSFRFLVLVPFFAPVTLALLLGYLQPRLRALAVTLLTFAFVLNTGLVVKTVVLNTRIHTPDPNHLQWATIKAVDQQGLTKGFGPYWDSIINTYLSNDRIIVIPANCADVQHFLMHDKALYQPAQKSFYIYNPSLMANCSQDKLAQTLGPPEKIIPIEGDVKLNIYNYDITRTLKAGYYYQ